MDEVEVERTTGSTATEIVGGSGTLQGGTLQNSLDGGGKGADAPLCDDSSESGARSDNGRREEEAGRFLLRLEPAADDLESKGAGPTSQLGGDVDGTAPEASTAPEAPTCNPSGDYSAPTRAIDGPREAVRASLTYEEDGSFTDYAHEHESLPSSEPVGHLEHDVASASPETVMTGENNETATRTDMASSKRTSPGEEEGIVLNVQQTDDASELSAATIDIHDEPAPSGMNNAITSSEAVVEKNVLQTSEESSESDRGTASTPSPEGGVPANSAEDAPGRAKSIVITSGSEGSFVGDSGASEEGFELLPSMAAEDEDLLAEGTSGVVSAPCTSMTQENPAGFAVSQAYTGDVLQHKLGSEDSRAMLPLEGADTDYILCDPAPSSQILIETVVSAYLSIAVAGAAAFVVVAPGADAQAPDEVPGNQLESRGSSSPPEEMQSNASACTESVVEPPEPGLMPIYDDTSNVREADTARGNDTASAVNTAAPQVSVKDMVVRDYLEQTLAMTTKEEIVAMATLGERSMAPERVAVICLDEAVDPISARGASRKTNEVKGLGLAQTEGLGETSSRPHLSEDPEGGRIETCQRGISRDGSKSGSQISEESRLLVDEVIARGLVTGAATVTARVRDVTYDCLSPAPESCIKDTCLPLCKSSLQSECPTEGAQTPRTVPSESTSTASVSCHDRNNKIDGEFSSSAPYGEEPFPTNDVADLGLLMGHETPQVGAPLMPESGESMTEHVTECRLGGTDNGPTELQSQQGDLPAAEFSTPAIEFEPRLSDSTVIDDDNCVTNADKERINCRRFVSIPDSPISAEARAGAEYLDHVVREAFAAAFRAQAFGNTSSDTGGSFPTTAQVHSQRITRDREIITSSEEESPEVPATSAEVGDGEKTSTDTDGAPAATYLIDQEVLTDSGNPSLPSSGSLQVSAGADSFVGACGPAVVAGDATALDLASRGVSCDPSPNGDESIVGVSGADFVQEGGEECSVLPLTEPAACPVAATLVPHDDRAAGPALQVSIESAADLRLTPMGQDVTDDPCGSSTLLPDSSDGGEIQSREIPIAAEVQSTSTEVQVGLQASGSPPSSVALRCKVVDDFLSEKLRQTVAVETASQISINAIEPRRHDGQRHSGEAVGQSGLDQSLAKESGDAPRSPPIWPEQGTPGKEVFGSIDSGAELSPDACRCVAQGQATPSSTNTLSCIPPSNETEDEPRPSPAEQRAPAQSSLAPPSVQDHDYSNSGRPGDPTDGEIRYSPTSTTPKAEISSAEARISSGASDNTAPPAYLRYKVMTGCLSNEISEVMAVEAAISSTSSRACGLEPAMGVRSEAGVPGNANGDRPSPASVRCEVVTGLLSDEVRGVVAAGGVVSSTSSRACLETSTSLRSETRVRSDANDKTTSSASPRYRVVTGCLSDEVRGVVPADMVASSGLSRARGLDSATGVQEEAPIGSDAVERNHAEERGVAIGPLDSPMRQDTPQQDLSDSIKPEVELISEPNPDIAETLSARLLTETLDNVSSNIYRPSDPNGTDTRQPENLERNAASSGEVEKGINQSLDSSSSSSVSLLRDAIVANYLANKFREVLVAGMATSVSVSTKGDFGLVSEARSDQTISSAPPGALLGTVPAASKTDGINNERSADEDDASLAMGLPLNETTEAERIPANPIEPSLPDGKQACCDAQAESGANGDERKKGIEGVQPTGTPTLPLTVLEETPLRSAEPDNESKSNDALVNAKPLASVEEAPSCFQEAGARTKVLEVGSADDRAGSAAWLPGVGGTAKYMQSKASEDRAGAVAWLHNIGQQETRVQGIRSDASAWLRETGEKAVSLQHKAGEARSDAVEWLTKKGVAELQRTKPTEWPRTASQQHLNGDGVDHRPRTESETSGKNIAEPYLQFSEKPTPGNRDCGPTASYEQQPSEPTVIDVAREAGQKIFLEEMMHTEPDDKATPPCPAELHRVEDDPVVTTHPLPCRSTISVAGDADGKPLVDRPLPEDWSAPPPSLETTATARVPHDDSVVTSELDPQESSQMLAVGENDWSRVSLSRTPPFDALNSPSIALRWEPAGKQIRSLPPDIGGFDSAAASATIADKVPVSGSAVASTATAAGVSGYVGVPSNNGGSEWAGFFAPPHRMAPTGDAYGADSVCSAKASASSTARRDSTGSTFPSYVSGEAGDGRIPQLYGDWSRTMNENGGHIEGGGAGYGARETERWLPPPADPRITCDSKRWNKAAERSRRYARRWQSFLSRIHRHFDSEVQVRKKISVVRRAHPDVSNEVAFVALAQSHGRASEAAAVLHLSRAKEEATLVTTMLDVDYFIRLTREAADARRRSRQLEEQQPTLTTEPQRKVVLRAHHQAREENQQKQQGHLTHHLQQWKQRHEGAAVQQQQREGSFLSSESAGFGGLSDGNTNASVDADCRGVGVAPEKTGKMVDRGRRRRLRGRPVPTEIDQNRRRMWSRGSESSPTLLPPIARLTDGTPPTPKTLKTVLATSTSVALEIPEGFGLTAEFGRSMNRDSDQEHAVKSTKRAQRAVLRARARFQRQRMAEIAAPTAHQNGSGVDAVTERLLLETGALHRDSCDLHKRLRAPKRNPHLGWGRRTLAYGNQSVDGSGSMGCHSSSALLASLGTAPCGEATVSFGKSPSTNSAETDVGYGNRESCLVQNYFTQALADDGFCRGKQRGGGGDERAVVGRVRGQRK